MSIDQSVSPSLQDFEVLERVVRVNGLLMGLAAGLLAGGVLCLSTFILLWRGGDHVGEHLSLLSIFLPGYSVTPEGAWVGFLWGFLLGGLIAFVAYQGYARLIRRQFLDHILARSDSPNELSGSVMLLSGHSTGLAAGLLFAAQIFLTTTWLVLRGTSEQSLHAHLLDRFLPGYDVTIFGAIVGAVQVFAVVYIGARIFASVYNRMTLAATQAEDNAVTVKVPQHNLLSPAERKKKHVVVLGAGPAGLSAGHELAISGVEVTVLERNDFVGGLCRTINVDGYRFDLGGHRWFTKNEHLNDWFRNLMKGEIVMVERISRIYYDGKYFQYPVEIMDVVKNAGVVTIIKAGFTYLWSAFYYLVFRPPIVNMQQAYTAQFGSTLYDMFFRRYTEKVWGKKCEELSSDWVSQRSKGLSIWTVLLEALSSQKSDIKSLIEEFMYPRDGYMRIPERMAEDIESQGNKVHLSSSVTRVVHHGENDIEVFYDSGAGETSIRATDVISTIPLGHLARMSEPAAPQAVIDAAKSLKFRDLITVNLQLRKDQVSKDTWLYVQDEAILFGRLHEPKNWSRAMVPDDEHTSLVLECFCTRGDHIWEMSDDEVAQTCVNDLVEKLRFIEHDEVEGWNVVRTLHTYPVYDMTYAGNVGVIKDHLAAMQGVHIVGRGGTFRYNNADHSIEMGLLLGRKILGFDVDPLDVNTEPEYQEIVDGELNRNQYGILSQPSSA